MIWALIKVWRWSCNLSLALQLQRTNVSIKKMSRTLRQIVSVKVLSWKLNERVSVFVGGLKVQLKTSANGPLHCCIIDFSSSVALVLLSLLTIGERSPAWERTVFHTFITFFTLYLWLDPGSSWMDISVAFDDCSGGLRTRHKTPTHAGGKSILSKLLNLVYALYCIKFCEKLL